MPPVGKTLQLFERIALEISKRMAYGVRKETATQPSRMAVWINSEGKWYVGFPTYKKGEEVTLDANQILVPAKGKRAIQKWFDSGEAPALPLYSGSYEATKEGRRLPTEDLLSEFVKRRTRELNPQIEQDEFFGKLFQQGRRDRELAEREAEVQKRRKGLRVVKSWSPDDRSPEQRLLDTLFGREPGE